MKKIIKYMATAIFLLNLIILAGFCIYTKATNVYLNDVGLWMVYWKEYLLGLMTILVLGSITTYLYSNN